MQIHGTSHHSQSLRFRCVPFRCFSIPQLCAEFLCNSLAALRTASLFHRYALLRYSLAMCCFAIPSLRISRFCNSMAVHCVSELSYSLAILRYSLAFPRTHSHAMPSHTFAILRPGTLTPASIFPGNLDARVNTADRPAPPPAARSGHPWPPALLLEHPRRSDPAGPRRC